MEKIYYVLNSLLFVTLLALASTSCISQPPTDPRPTPVAEAERDAMWSQLDEDTENLSLQDLDTEFLERKFHSRVAEHRPGTLKIAQELVRRDPKSLSAAQLEVLARVLEPSDSDGTDQAVAHLKTLSRQN